MKHRQLNRIGGPRTVHMVAAKGSGSLAEYDQQVREYMRGERATKPRRTATRESLGR